jgi:hypothetical protein|tara:strand:+ start:139 stop:522 length:384 start_codon:yes stop_codon:yes gene_type:complete
MAIKLILLKSGEDMIADVKEMTVGEDDARRVVGYYLNRPCVIKMRDPNVIPELQKGNTKKAGYEVSLFPWIPLSAEETVPIPSDWLVTMVEPAFKLKEMYIEDIVSYGKDDSKSTTTDDGSDSDNSD